MYDVYHEMQNINMCRIESIFVNVGNVKLAMTVIYVYYRSFGFPP